ncbi:MAG TPA: hypothetical protein VJ881_05285, partial [Halanaerobiales bacterium]|nr:hypothetical protein [Halanaerobiales bacterium]
FLFLTKIMKTLDFNQMENLEGGGAASIICGGGFLGYSAIVTYALALGGVTAGVSAVVGLGIGAVGIAVCSLAE